MVCTESSKYHLETLRESHTRSPSSRLSSFHCVPGHPAQLEIAFELPVTPRRTEDALASAQRRLNSSGGHEDKVLYIVFKDFVLAGDRPCHSAYGGYFIHSILATAIGSYSDRIRIPY
ncbi:uncharacterized protein LOC143019476 [Oratosquilla oratoria]|uniref:uncharacterized protein LOC143019476 n=1 Tax=Oratosquilla oratoria TaxID=337810 RepID=UPI003F767DC9